MKTNSGFREIDFSKVKCKNCGYFTEYFGYLDVGKVIIPPNYKKIVSCPKCNGTGYLNENNRPELELE